MYTQCPHCQTCFRIAEDHLKIANGKVRCGSCQEVFDATQHLFKNLTDREPIAFNKPTPTPPPATPAPEPEAKTPPAPPRETEKVDLNRANTPSPSAVEKILNERQKTPDQTPFMESTIDNDRYNDLDQIGAIDIPGQIDFDDSIINFADDESPKEKPDNNESPTPAISDEHLDIDFSDAAGPSEDDTHQLGSPSPSADQEPTPANRTIYEDLESRENPATDSEKETLENFFAEVDAQLTTDNDKSSLDQDIDELLAFARGLDQDSAQNQTGSDTSESVEADSAAKQGNEIHEEFDMQAIADFEKELEASNPGVFSTGTQQGDSATAEPSADSSLEETSVPADDSTAAGNKPEEDVPAAAPSEPEVAIASKASETPPGQAQEEEEDVPRALRRSLEMLKQKPRRSLGMTLLMSLLILILLGGLGFQVILFQNVELAHKFPQFVPELTKICSRIPCRYSGKVDVSQIKLLNRDVRSDPNQPNALLISATFVDQAPFDQPYPIIKITLYDLGGNVVASRRFTPKEYLQKMYNRFLLMESGTPVHITLAVLDPGKDAINFEFTFL